MLVGPTTAFLAGTVLVWVLLTLLALLIPGNAGIFVIIPVVPAMVVGGNAAKTARHYQRKRQPNT
jgi:uncharacterized membrane-anchored protein